MSVSRHYFWRDCGHRRMVAVAARADSQAVAGGKFNRRRSPAGASPVPAAKVGLGFSSPSSAACSRCSSAPISCGWTLADWRPLPAAEAAMVQHGRADPEQCGAAMGAGCRRPGTNGRRQGRPARRRRSAVAFLVGQLLAWRQLVAAGYFVAGNPANAFFYLITARAWAALVGRLGGSGQDGRQGLAWRST